MVAEPEEEAESFENEIAKRQVVTLLDMNDTLVGIMARLPTTLDLLAANAPDIVNGEAMPDWYQPSVPKPDPKEQDARGLSPHERQAEFAAYWKAYAVEWPYAWARAVLEARDRAS